MNKRNTIYWIAGFFVLLGLVYLMHREDDSYDWSTTYEIDSTHPYGTSILGEILKSSCDSSDFIIVRDTLMKVMAPDSDIINSNYVFLGFNHYINYEELDYLLDFVHRGNNAYLCVEMGTGTLMDSLLYRMNEYTYDDEEWSYDRLIYSLQDSSITIDFNDQQIDFYYQYERDSISDYWRFFTSAIKAAVTDTVYIEGHFNEDYINHIRIPWGEGNIHLHLNPICFTNIQLLDEAKFEYANHVFKDLKPGKIFWDENNRYYEFISKSTSNGTEVSNTKEGPLSFILSSTPLKWTWYGILLLTGVYVIFGARRKQKIIPVIDRNENTSIEFAETVSQLYLRKKEHRELCQLKFDQFFTYVRNHYNIKIKTQDDSERDIQLKSLAVKSNIPLKNIETIMHNYRQILVAEQVSDNLLISLHKNLEYFYLNSK